MRVLVLDDGESPLAIAGIRLRSILSAELFGRMVAARLGQRGSLPSIASACHDCWTDLADAIAASPTPLEILSVVTPRRGGESPSVVVAFLAVRRGTQSAEAEEACRKDAAELWTLLATIVDYAELEPIVEAEILEAAGSALRAPHVTEFRRRLEPLQLTDGLITPVAGFGNDRRGTRTAKKSRHVSQLFCWVPSDDPWRRLVEVLVAEPGTASLVVHARGWSRAPQACIDAARSTLIDLESLQFPRQPETLLQSQIDVLRHEALRRLAIVEGRTLAARIFLTTTTPASSAMVATVLGSIDDASIHPERAGAAAAFHGGARILSATADDVLAPLDTPSLDLQFGPREAITILRTPMPVDEALPGIAVHRARTAVCLGRSGDDAPIGVNVHRGTRSAISLDESIRFRHTYVVGQTGTGKSTLLLRMILADLQRGRGVAVIDPHGSLIDSVLLHLPAERADDVVILDVTDSEWPVSFNVLRIHEADPARYALARDMLIDDLHAFLERTYDMRVAGGPMFETHFRGMLALLLGTQPQRPPQIPNLMLFRSLYTRPAFRRKLADAARGADPLLDDFLAEAMAAKGETTLANVAPYVTSKFTRFIADLSLRNITCQSDALDLEEIVADGRVLLCNLGKGRFGDAAASLLGGQVLSRIRYAVLKRGVSRSHRPFYFYADEFQLLADTRFAELLAEARKYGLSLTLAHQYLGQLAGPILQGVLGNVGTVIAFRVGAQDGDVLSNLFEPHFSSRDLCSQPNYRAYVRSFGSLGPEPFSIEVPAPPAGGDPALALRVRERSRERHSKPRAEVEEELQRVFDAQAGDST